MNHARLEIEIWHIGREHYARRSARAHWGQILPKRLLLDFVLFSLYGQILIFLFFCFFEENNKYVVMQLVIPKSTPRKKWWGGASLNTNVLDRTPLDCTSLHDHKIVIDLEKI